MNVIKSILIWGMFYGRKSTFELIPNYVTVIAHRLNCLVGFIQVKERPLQVVKKKNVSDAFIHYVCIIHSNWAVNKRLLIFYSVFVSVLQNRNTNHVLVWETHI